MLDLSKPAETCGRHSQIPATQHCAQCAMPLCDTCVRPQAGGSIKCPVCSVAAGTPQMPRPRIPMAAPMVSQACALHPEVKTSRRCAGCGAPICETCDFSLPGHIHICPTCAMNSPTGLSSSRKKQVIIGMLLAIWCTAAMALLLLGALADSGMSETGAGYAIMALIFVPSLIGFAVSWCAQDRRLHNPVSVWVAIAWNSLLVLGYIALVVVGLMA